MLYGVTFGLAVAVAQRHKLLDDTPSSSLLWPRPLSALAAAAALAGVAGYAVFALYCGKAGLKFRCHDLRHKFAIDYLTAGGDIYELSRILGHSSVKTTEIYLAYAGTIPGTEATVRNRKAR